MPRGKDKKPRKSRPPSEQLYRLFITKPQPTTHIREKIESIPSFDEVTSILREISVEEDKYIVVCQEVYPPMSVRCIYTIDLRYLDTSKSWTHLLNNIIKKQ